MKVGQASSLSNFIEVVLRFAGLQLVHRLEAPEAYATFHCAHKGVIPKADLPLIKLKTVTTLKNAPPDRVQSKYSKTPF